MPWTVYRPNRGLWVGLLLWLVAAPAVATTFQVHSEAQLAAAITTANATTGPHFIELQNSITLTASLPPLLTTMTIKGRGYTLDGAAQYQLLTVGTPDFLPGPRILVLVNDLVLANARATGADGSAGGGGGLGAGAALLVGPRADVVLNSVQIFDSQAAGGNGAAGAGGAGGGLNGAAGAAGSLVADGADGTFGAGGGSGLTLGGDGGLGAGGGAGAAGGGTGGPGGGAGGLAGGGGGAGLGGAIFVVEGGGLTLSGGSNIAGNTATGGSGVLDGTAGSGAGGGLFLQGSGNLMVRGPAAGAVQVIDDDIADAWGAGLTGALPYERWNLIVTGGSREGLIQLGGNNNYSGDTYILGSTLVVQQDQNLGGTNGIVVLDDGGIGMPGGFTLTRDVVVNSGGGAFTVVDDGMATIAGNLRGEGGLIKDGAGTVRLLANTNFDGYWDVLAGTLLLDTDARLGNASLRVNGGGLGFSTDMSNLREFSVGENGAFLDNGGNTVTFNNDILDWGADSTVIFRGAGRFVLNGTAAGDGNTLIESGHVTGDIASGALQIDAGGVWSLGGANRQVALVGGVGAIELGSNRLTVRMEAEPDSPANTAFDGVISGTGSLTVSNAANGLSDPLLSLLLGDFRTVALNGVNTYTGGTRITGGAVVVIADDGNVGTGPVTLAGGSLLHSGTVSNINLLLAGGGNFATAGNDLLHTGVITGAGTLVKAGPGTLTLDHANTFSGSTWVIGSDSYIALANPGALGSSSLNLAEGGGLRLLADTPALAPLRLHQGGGVVDTGIFEARTTGGILSFDPTATLVKAGSGALIVTGNSSFANLVQINEGTLQLGTGGAAGSVGGDVFVADGAHLRFDRSGTLTFGGAISGGGDVIKDGSGTVLLASDSNTFAGGLTVLAGRIAAATDAALGAGVVLLDGGGLDFRGTINRELAIGAGGGDFFVAGDNEQIFGGIASGAGELRKTGTGTLIVAGQMAPDGDVHVVEGALQIGEGYTGWLFAGAALDAGTELRFARADALAYEGVISGTGTVVQQGPGDTLLTGDHTYTGPTRIEAGTLRVGGGGTTGSIVADAEVQAGARLLFNRSDDVSYNGVLTGAGTVGQDGLGRFTLGADNSAFAGLVQVSRGTLVLDGAVGGAVNVSAGALEGSGHIFGNLDVLPFAVLRPGSATVPLQVDGNVTMNPASRWEADIFPDGSADRLLAGGTVQLAGDLVVTAGSGTFASGMVFRLIDANSVTGTFARLDENLAFLDAELVYGLGAVELQLTRNGSSLGSVTLTRNQQAVADALEQMPMNDPLVSHVLGLDEVAARNAFDAFSGDSLLAAVTVPNRLGSVFMQGLQRRGSRLGNASRGPADGFAQTDFLAAGLSALRAGIAPSLPQPGVSPMLPAHAAPVSRVEGVWLEAQQVSQHENVDDVVGNAETEFDGSLLALGFDGYWRDDLILGAALAQGSGSVGFGDRTASGDLDTLLLGVYGRWDFASQLHLKFSLSSGVVDAQLQRTVPVGAPLSASTATTVTGASAELGMALRAGHWGLRPYGQLFLQQASGGGYTETGGPAALVVDASKVDLAQLAIGLEVSRPWLLASDRWAQLQAGIGLLQPLGDGQAAQSAHFVGSAVPFTVQAAPEDAAAFTLNLGGEWYLARNLALWLGCQGRFGGSGDEQDALASIHYRW